jgi:hypothetical protein
VDAKWKIEFYEDAQGRRPVEKWIDGLSDQKAEAVIVALQEVLAVNGINLASGAWLKSLGVAFEGAKLIVLLGAYDKGKNDKQGFQQAQIEVARKRLKEWKRRRA